MESSDFRDALMAIQGEFLDMPGLKLTMSQTARLWALPDETCRTAFTALVSAGFLLVTADGAYARRGTPPVHITPIDASTCELAPAPRAA